MSELKSSLDKRVRIITTDARLFEGILRGFDKSTNVVVENCIERIIYTKPEEENEKIELGLYLMRGDNIVCVGEVDEQEDSKIDWIKVKGHALKGTKNPL